MVRQLLMVGLGLLCAASQASAGITLTLQDLGDGGGGYSYGYAINENGQATGTTTVLGRPDSRAFYWNGSTMSIIDDSPVVGSGFGFDINNGVSFNGQIVGMVNSRAFRWDAVRGFTLLDPENFGSANGITPTGVMIGERFASNTTMFWSPNGVGTEINPDANSRAVAINLNFEVVGTNSSGGYFSRVLNQIQPMFSIPIDTPTDLNLARQIVGSVTGIASLFDFNTSTLTTIGKLDPADLSSIALGINSHGTVVGASGLRGFIYDSTMGLQDATSLLRDDYLGWTILALEDINDKGQMIGVGRLNGVDHAVILTPVAVPEPNYVGDAVRSIKAAYRMAGDAIVHFCEPSDECEVKPAAEPGELRIETADAETVEAAAQIVASAIDTDKSNAPSKARAEKAIEKLRSRH